MATLNGIINDNRMARLVAPTNDLCVVELWILQLREAKSTEGRLLYGRVLPSNFRNDKWNATDDDSFQQLEGDLSAQLVRLTLHTTALTIRELLILLTAGQSIASASAQLGVAQSPAALRLTSIGLGIPLAFRPTMHLPSRGYYSWRTKRLSTFEVSADSAAITSLTKGDLFSKDNAPRSQLLEFATDHLNKDTGLDFLAADAWRLGDLELLVAPCLDERERFRVEIDGSKEKVAVTMQQGVSEIHEALRVRLKLLNDSSIYHLDEKLIVAGAVFPADIAFAAPAGKDDMLDGFEVEIDAVNVNNGEVRPCLIWGVHLVREIHQHMQLTGGQSRITTDWLSAVVQPKHRERLEKTQNLSSRDHRMSSAVGGRATDPWVPANRGIGDFVARLAPPDSEGKFFLHYAEAGGEGRLQLVEWLQNTLRKYRGMQVAWFDPYMEDVGINYLNQYGSGDGNYLVFTSCTRTTQNPWYRRWWSWVWASAGFPEKLSPHERRIKVLLKACQRWVTGYGSVRLSVIGIPEGLHDRMLLVRNQQMEPIAGYHLSNSIQHANENFPLLITPIPADVLPSVFRYQDDVVKTTVERNAVNGSGAISNLLLFDSLKQQKERPAYRQIPVLSTSHAGHVLAWWASRPELKGLQEPALQARLETLGMFSEGKLAGDLFNAVPSTMWTSGLPVSDFNKDWDALGVIFANTAAGDNLGASGLNPDLIRSLYLYLDPSRMDAISPPQTRIAPLDMAKVLAMPLDALLVKVAAPWQLVREYLVEVFWGDYYAIKILWMADPQGLVKWIEENIPRTDEPNLRQHLCLQCAVRLIGSESELGFASSQLDALLTSRNDLLRWMGLIGLEESIQANPVAVRNFVLGSNFTRLEQIRIVAWLVARSYHDRSIIFRPLVKKLFAILSRSVTDEQFETMLKGLAGHMQRLSVSDQWIFVQVVAPLIEQGRVAIDQAASAWMNDLLVNWDNSRSSEIVLFQQHMEGNLTNVAGYLVATSSPSMRAALINKLKKQLNAAGRIVLRPGAATRNWKENDVELTICLWIAALANKILFFLPRPNQEEATLEALILKAQALADRRSLEDWKKCGMEQLLDYRDT